ncbi:hypothetical protein BT96DRAFT_654455 [Gymnopus androsaceus JB14]|uniref:Uncharacterized protein n=1 Tax=Gymnopus androsaceus JB14 TaxID=1447944 RepID=A0A6A4HQB8_9AGAR|nr:hypothetical protein BT96DRAFT_654455 [Gymnopus androsaceus JB14]
MLGCYTYLHSFIEVVFQCLAVLVLQFPNSSVDSSFGSSSNSTAGRSSISTLELACITFTASLACSYSTFHIHILLPGVLRAWSVNGWELDFDVSARLGSPDRTPYISHVVKCTTFLNHEAALSM